MSGLITVQRPPAPATDAAAERAAREHYVRSPLTGRRYLLGTLTRVEANQVACRPLKPQ